MFLVVEEIKIVWIYIIWLNWKIKFCLVCVLGSVELYDSIFNIKIHKKHIVIVLAYVHTEN